MGYVRNRDQQTKSFTLTFAVHRVVEIACGFAVDGDKRQIAQIGAAFDIGRSNFFRHLLFQRLNVIGPDVGKIMLAERNLDLHARVGVVSQHLRHACDRLGILGRLCNQIDHHHLPTFRATIEARLDEDVLADTFILGDYKQHTALGK